MEYWGLKDYIISDFELDMVFNENYIYFDSNYKEIKIALLSEIPEDIQREIKDYIKECNECREFGVPGYCHVTARVLNCVSKNKIKLVEGYFINDNNDLRHHSCNMYKDYVFEVMPIFMFKDEYKFNRFYAIILSEEQLNKYYKYKLPHFLPYYDLKNGKQVTL